MTGVSDEAVEAAYNVLDEHGHNGLDCRPKAGFDQSVRLALEAALPFMLCSCPHISEVDDYCPQHGRDS